MKYSLFTLLTTFIFIFSCKEGDNEPIKGDPSKSGTPELLSSFADKAMMPVESGKYNGNVSPPLTIKNVPANTVEIVLTMRDLDYNNSWHWAIWGIPSSKTDIAKGETWTGIPVTIGSNDYGTNYVGPFPPAEHRYEITVFFLSEVISLLPTQYKSLPDEMSGKTIAKASIIGTYQ